MLVTAARRRLAFSSRREREAAGGVAGISAAPSLEYRRWQKQRFGHDGQRPLVGPAILLHLLA
jgi:hypothetical protein